MVAAAVTAAAPVAVTAVVAAVMAVVAAAVTAVTAGTDPRPGARRITELSLRGHPIGAPEAPVGWPISVRTA
jgi:hypothetical protein